MTDPRLSAAEVAHLFRRSPGLIAIYAERVNGRIRLSDVRRPGAVSVGNFDGSVDVSELEERAHMALLAKGV